MSLDDAIDSLTRYVEHGIPTGSCLRAILENDLMETFNRADETTLLNLPAIVRYVYNRVPFQCHGSPAKVHNWLQYKRDQQNAARRVCVECGVPWNGIHRGCSCDAPPNIPVTKAEYDAAVMGARG